MREIEAYETSDGTLFNDETAARRHQEDIIGEMLDGLVAYDQTGNFTRVSRHRVLLNMLKDPDLKKKVAALHAALTHGDD